MDFVSKQIANGHHAFVAKVRRRGAGAHHRVGTEAQHHGARVELHDVLQARPATGDEQSIGPPDTINGTIVPPGDTSR